MRVSIRAGIARGTLSAPPSKSMAHRLLLCAALAEGVSTVHGVAQSEDLCATLDCIRALGADWTRADDTVTVRGGLAPTGLPFCCRESGSTLRFFIPVSLLSGGDVTFTGTERLMERGIGIYEAVFAEKGIGVQKSPDRLRLHGRLSAGEYTLSGGVSSQFISGLLFALPLLAGDSTLRILPPVESRPYLDLTRAAQRQFGIHSEERTRNCFSVAGGQCYRAAEVSVEGDWSNAAALLALNALGGDVRLSGLSRESLQGDRVCEDYLAALERPDAVLDLSACPDLAPVLFAVAAAKHGAHFTGTRRLRLKESDRAQTMATELKKFGVFTRIEEDTVTVAPAALTPPTEPLEAHNDHRIVMALALLASVTGGVIEGAQAVKKSYPTFFDDLRRVGLEITYGA